MSLSRFRARLQEETGFTLVTVIAVMAVVVLFSAGALAAVNGDMGSSAQDVTRKQALAAAEAGVADYLFHLNQDSAYWTKCTAAAAYLNDPWAAGAAPPTTSDKWRGVPGSTSRYTIELLPARNSGYTKCDSDPDNVRDSMIDPTTRSLRIRVTGSARGANGEVRRSVIATVRRTNFLDFLYFTNYETSGAVWTDRITGGNAVYPANPAQGQLKDWAAANCTRYYRPAPAGSATDDGYNRRGQVWRGLLDANSDGAWDWPYPYAYTPVGCTEIQFASNDELLGPVHTNDEMNVCHNSTFGRQDSSDRIESGAKWRPCDGDSDTQPKIQGTFIENAGTLDLPPTDGTLETVAKPEYTFTGKTEIVVKSNSTIDVRNANIGGGAWTNMAYPSNGVVFVKNGDCQGYQYKPLNPYNDQPGPGVPVGCGDAWVKGTYNKDLTIAAQNDVIVNGNVIRLDTSDARFGLIADGMVRVEHRVLRTSADRTRCTEPSPTIDGRRIDAALLSVQNSITVDNFYCGSAIGTLTVNGVLAQNFRGAVGTPSGGPGGGRTGFVKDYNYDERLAYKGPPHFIDPVQSAWKVRSYTEQQPAR